MESNDPTSQVPVSVPDEPGVVAFEGERFEVVARGADGDFGFFVVRLRPLPSPSPERSE